MRNIVSLLDGSLIHNVSQEELNYVQSLMLRQGIITEVGVSLVLDVLVTGIIIILSFGIMQSLLMTVKQPCKH